MSTMYQNTENSLNAIPHVSGFQSIRLLDLCCKAGGASFGYYQAAIDLGLNIEITGIDIEFQPNYPFHFIQADAVEYLKNSSMNFTHIHASPPCQMYSNSTANHRMKGKVYKDNLIEIVEIMKKINVPCIVENVMPAPIPGDIVLRGDMFNLQVLKKRKFHLINWF